MGEDIIWWKHNPLLLQELRNSLLQYPKLELLGTDDTFTIQGDWDVFGESKYIRSYKIQIIIPDNYPHELPRVFEIGSQIKRIEDRHINVYDGSACLFAPPERWEKWPPTLGLKDFLNGPVKEFFFSQAYFDLTGIWPFGDRKHGDDGIIEYYLDRLKLENENQLFDMLKYFQYNNPMRQWKCPCDHTRRLKTCHWDAFINLRKIIPVKEWDTLRSILHSRYISKNR